MYYCEDNLDLNNIGWLKEIIINQILMGQPQSESSQTLSENHYHDQSISKQTRFFYHKQTVFRDQKPSKVESHQLRQLPHRLIGAILFQNNNLVMGVTTGILISPDLVLTSSSTLIKVLQSTICSRFRFYPSHSSPVEMSIEVKSWHIVDNKCQEKGLLKDYALLQLVSPVQNLEFLKLQIDFKGMAEGDRLLLFGFKAKDLDFFKFRSRYQLQLHQWGLDGKRENIEGINHEIGQIFYQISSVPGQTGAPLILLTREGKMSIIGIHIGTKEMKTDPFQVNYGQLLTNNVVVELKRQARLRGAVPFETQKGPSQNLNSQPKSVTYSVQELVKKGEKCLEEKDPLQALNYFNKVLLVEPQNVDHFIRLGTTYYKLNKLDKAMKTFKKAYEIEPKGITILYNIAVILEHQQQFQQSNQWYSKILEIQPNNVFAQYKIGNYHLSQGRLVEAIECFKNTLRISPNNINCYNGLASAYEQLDNIHQAVKTYRQALTRNPKSAVILSNLGAALIKLGRLDEAYYCCKDAVYFDSSSVRAHRHLGRALWKRDKVTQAQSEFYKAIEMCPKDQGLYLELHDLLVESGRQEEGLNFLERIQSEHPDCQQAKAAAAVLSKGLGQR